MTFKGTIKKIIFPVILGIILYVINSPVKETPAIKIIGGADGSTTIYIGASIDWKLFLLLLIAIDLILLIIKKIIEYKRKKNIDTKYFILFVLIFNIITALLLFPFMIIHTLVLNAIILFIYLI